MKTEHTKGPWRIDSQTRFGDFTIAAGENVKACEFIAKTQSEANARLIAAAPELLTALEDIVKLANNTDFYLPRNWLEDARSAISKVEGNA